MLVSSTGHVKLTDFGLSKIELRRGKSWKIMWLIDRKYIFSIIDLELSDLINCSPNLNARTPGQLLSLTSHLSFGSNEAKRAAVTSNFMEVINKHSKFSVTTFISTKSFRSLKNQFQNHQTAKWMCLQPESKGTITAACLAFHLSSQPKIFRNYHKLLAKMCVF